MLTRRHIRVKVMQSLYAYSQSQNDNLKVEEKFLLKSMDGMYDLYLLMLDLMVEIKDHTARILEKSKEKHLPSEEDKNPNLKFINNAVIALIENNENLKLELETRRLTHWRNDDEYVAILWEELKKSELYENYMNTRESSFKEDKAFVIDLFREIIAPNGQLYDYLEDRKLTWLDDFPLVNTAIVKMLQKLKQNSDGNSISKMYRNKEDEEFGVNLFRRTLLNDEAFAAEMEGKTPNWDKERIAELDTVLIKMAICEFLRFPSIPVKVTINEYLEVAKEYSTPKSSIFINGVLDKLSKEYQQSGKLNKIGRGLM